VARGFSISKTEIGIRAITLRGSLAEKGVMLGRMGPAMTESLKMEGGTARDYGDRQDSLAISMMASTWTT
jgi:hypothetical protein